MILHALLIGAFVGIGVGSLGAGSGIVSVPILVYVLGQDPHQATGLSLIIVGLTAAVSLATRARSGNVAWREGPTFALAGLVGTWAGSTLGPLISARPYALLLRSPGSGRGLHGPFAAASHGFVIARGRGTAA